MKANINMKKTSIPSIIILMIIVLSTLFHYTIHIEDALTLEILPEFGISISIWRILSEPIMGLILFFNRILYSIDELYFTLVWALLVFIFYSIIKLLIIIEEKKKFIISQIINLPLIFGMAFTVFVFIIFIPLPNNTIINNSAKSVLVATHSHSEYSHDGLISQLGLWQWHKRNGFDAFFITEHNNHNRTLDFVEAQRKNEFPIAPLVMCGEEYSGTNHLSLLGIKRKFSTTDYADSTIIDSVQGNNGAVLVNHWFDGKRMSLEYYKNIGVDGFEIENSATERVYDRTIYREIKEYCKRNDLIMNGGSDFHGYGNFCSIWNAFEIPNWDNLDPDSKEKAILNIIKTNNQDKLKVLIYKDRPFYDSNNLFFSPLFTFFNYFRTLNIYQVISWIFWVILFAVIKNKLNSSQKFKQWVSVNKLIPIFSLLSSLFMLILGLVYYLRIENIIGFTEMYEEYSTVLFYVGAALSLYSSIILVVRNKTIRSVEQS
jgi:PHP domain